MRPSSSSDKKWCSSLYLFYSSWIWVVLPYKEAALFNVHWNSEQIVNYTAYYAGCFFFEGQVLQFNCSLYRPPLLHGGFLFNVSLYRPPSPRGGSWFIDQCGHQWGRTRFSPEEWHILVVLFFLRSQCFFFGLFIYFFLLFLWKKLTDKGTNKKLVYLWTTLKDN